MADPNTFPTNYAKALKDWIAQGGDPAVLRQKAMESSALQGQIPSLQDFFNARAAGDTAGQANLVKSLAGDNFDLARRARLADVMDAIQQPRLPSPPPPGSTFTMEGGGLGVGGGNGARGPWPKGGVAPEEILRLPPPPPGVDEAAAFGPKVSQTAGMESAFGPNLAQAAGDIAGSASGLGKALRFVKGALGGPAIAFAGGPITGPALAAYGALGSYDLVREALDERSPLRQMWSKTGEAAGQDWDKGEYLQAIADIAGGGLGTLGHVADEMWMPSPIWGKGGAIAHLTGAGKLNQNNAPIAEREKATKDAIAQAQQEFMAREAAKEAAKPVLPAGVTPTHDDIKNYMAAMINTQKVEPKGKELIDRMVADQMSKVFEAIANNAKASGKSVNPKDMAELLAAFRGSQPYAIGSLDLGAQ